VNGGDLTNVNPKTNLPEFGFFSSLKKIVKKAAAVVIPVVAGAVCGPACAAAASGIYTKATGGSWGDALKAAVFSYAGSSFAQGAGYGQQAGTFSEFMANPAGQLGKAFTNLNPFSSAPGAGSYWQAGGNTATGSFADPNIFTRAGSQFAQSTGIGAAQGQGLWSGAPQAAAGPQFYGATGADISTMAPAQQEAYRTAASQAMSAPGAPPAAVHKAGIEAAAKAGQMANAATASGAVGQGAAATAQASKGILGTGISPGTLAAASIPMAATLLMPQQEIPENELAKYDQEQRQKIQEYNACVRAGGTNCQVPEDLASVGFKFETAPQTQYASYSQPVGSGTSGIQSIDEIYRRAKATPTVDPTRAMYAAAGGSINGPGTGTSDSIPAMLSDGEFVMTARAVRGAGNGSRKDGVRRMYKMMRQFEGAA
jgi:hypothetical protein